MRLQNKIFFFSIFIFLSFFYLTSENKVLAQTKVPSPAPSNTPAQVNQAEGFFKSIGITAGTLIPENCIRGPQDKGNNCTIEDAFTVIGNFATLILGVIGSVSLLMFVYAGFMFLISGGSSDKINSAKTILRNSVIGITLIFTAWIIVNFMLIALTGQSNFGSPAKLFNKSIDTGPPNSKGTL